MTTISICLAAFSASLLTLFSGFGLGTILLPVFAIFFPVPIAVAATAIVHLLNNVFKVFLVGRQAHWMTVFRFAIPAVVAAICGAFLLKYLQNTGNLIFYKIGSKIFEITPVKLTIGILIITFSLMELLPHFKKLSFPSKYLPFGGVLSGFFGGLSGLQGALRSAFLIRAGLSKDEFIGTSVISAVLVDISRLVVYGITFYSAKVSNLTDDIWILVIFATLSAFAGAFIGKLLVKKVTIDYLQVIVGIMLIVIGVALAAGVV